MKAFQRIGKFAIASVMVENEIEPAVKQVMASCFVMRAEFDPLMNQFNYIGQSPLFEPLPYPGAPIPFYDWVITLDPYLHQRSIKAVKREIQT